MNTLEDARAEWWAPPPVHTPLRGECCELDVNSSDASPTRRRAPSLRSKGMNTWKCDQNCLRRGTGNCETQNRDTQSGGVRKGFFEEVAWKLRPQRRGDYSLEHTAAPTAAQGDSHCCQLPASPSKKLPPGPTRRTGPPSSNHPPCPTRQRVSQINGEISRVLFSAQKTLNRKIQFTG